MTDKMLAFLKESAECGGAHGFIVVTEHARYAAAAESLGFGSVSMRGIFPVFTINDQGRKAITNGT